jgi:hypothetical protein
LTRISHFAESFVFNDLSRVLFRRFRNFKSGVDLAAAPFKSDLVIIARNSEKGKLLLIGKDRFARCDRLPSSRGAVGRRKTLVFPTGCGDAAIQGP